MSFQPVNKPPSGCETECPDCGVTLSRQADMNRHRKTQHSDGTETKFHCPWPGCQYKAMQKGNLKAHIDARHLDGPQYPCPDCNDAFGDAAARIRHRKSVHGYEPYHTEEYIARLSHKGKERVPRGPGKAESSNTRRQRAASAAPYSVPQPPSSDARPPKLVKVTYHDDFWMALVKMARYYAANPEHLQDIQVGLPLATNPGPDTPQASQPLPDLALQPVASTQPFSYPSNLTSDGSGILDFQLDAMSPQGQAFAGPSTQGNTAAYPVTSDYTSMLPHTEIDTTFFKSGELPTYSGVGFVNQPQEFPMYSYGDTSSLMPDAITVPTTHTSRPQPSVDLQLPFIPNGYEPATLEPVPQAGPSWSSSHAFSAPPQFDDFFGPGNAIDFDTWYQSSLVAPELSFHS